MASAQSEYSCQGAEVSSSVIEHTDLIWTVDIEQALATARPRLARQAQRRGITPDAIDDVVQETLVVAWESLNALRTPESFNAWLDGICRNICLRWSETHQREVQRQSRLQHLWQEEDADALEVADTFALDPVEELNRQDLATLLDQALRYLPPETRQIIEMCYLAELPQREVAWKLGLTINVLEARLHRARRLLRQVLSSDLRDNAQAFGLSIDDDIAQGWRDTREWCWYCGRHRLQGTFEPMSHPLVPNPINLRMRCPACSDIFGSGGYPSLEGLRSFRPAMKRMMRVIGEITDGLEMGWSTCPFCGKQQTIRVLLPDEYQRLYYEPSDNFSRRSMIVMACHDCAMRVVTSVEGSLWLHPAIQRFKREHPRSFVEPEVILDYDSQKAIQIRLTDITSAAQLTLLVQQRTLNVLAIHQ